MEVKRVCSQVVNFLNKVKPAHISTIYAKVGYPTLHNVVMTMKLAPASVEHTIAYVPAVKEIVGKKDPTDGIKYISPHHVVSASGVTQVNSDHFLSNTLRLTKDGKPIGTISMYGSASLNGVGSNNVHLALFCLHIGRLLLYRLGYVKMVVKEVCLHNKVFSGELGHNVDISRMCEEDMNCIKCRGTFQAAMYFQVAGDRICMAVVFKTGRVILMAVREKRSEAEVIDSLKATVSRYRVTVSDAKNSVNPEFLRMQNDLRVVLSSLTPEEIMMDAFALKTLISERLATCTTKPTKTLGKKRGRRPSEPTTTTVVKKRKNNII